MEAKFLLYLLYATLIGIRERSYENKDTVTFNLCDLLHNVPLQLNSEEGAKEAYSDLLNNVKSLGLEKWMKVRQTEFYDRFPEFRNSN